MTEQTVAIEAFLPFYRHMITEETVRNELHDVVSDAVAPDNVDSVLHSVWGALLGIVEGFSFRMLIGEYHRFRTEQGLPTTTETDTCLRMFSEHLDGDGSCAGLRATYQVLDTRLRTVLRNCLHAQREMFGAFASDKAVLAEAGLLGSGDGQDPIAEVFLAGSDLHNDNRQVIGLRLASGQRLVFKPRALVPDAFVRELYEVTEPYLKHSLAGAVPASVTVGSHGWQQFVTPAPMDSPEAAHRYFYRLGALCSLLGSIGASDLHDENLLAAGETPCIIDTETLLRPDAGVLNDTLPHTLLNQTKLSVVSTMMVPMSNPTSPIDVLMAGIGVAGDQVSKMTRSVVRDGDTDGIRVARDPVVYSHSINLPKLGERALSATDYFGDLLGGYFDALKAVRDRVVVDVCERYPDMPVRVLLRSTLVYSRFIDAATHPDYLAAPEEASRLFGLLEGFADYLPEHAIDWVRTAERSSLQIGDVPYFVTEAGSLDVRTLKSAGTQVYKCSPLDFAKRGVEMNAARPDEYHHLLLEECLSELLADRSSGLSEESLFGKTLTKATTAGSWWTTIAGQITRLGVPFDGPHGQETGWVCGIGPDRNAPTVTAGNYISFHDNGGIAAFLQRAASHEPALVEQAKAAERGLTTLCEEYDELLVEMPESVFSGASSLLLAGSSRVDGAWFADVLDRIEQRVTSGAAEIDLANGPAGALMALLGRADRSRLCDAAQLDRLRTLVSRTPVEFGDRFWFELAHGELGVRWAQARIGAAGGDIDLAGASADWLLARLEGDPWPEHFGWCNGSAGLLLASAEILNAAGRAGELSGARLEKLLADATRLPADGAIDLSVCHGTSGVVQSLLAAGRVLGDPSMARRARTYQDTVARRARTDGFFTGTAGKTALLGYMLGWAGIGDTDLLLHSVATTGDIVADDVCIPVALGGSDLK